MIKAKMNKKFGKARVTVSGRFGDIVTETLGIIKIIYDELNRQYPDYADEYKRVLASSVLDPNGPIFKKEEE